MDLTNDVNKQLLPKQERWRYPRFFVDSELVAGEQVSVSGADEKHIRSVLRMKRGSIAVLCDKNSQDALARVVEMSDGAVVFEVIETQPNEAEPRVKIRLFQCMPKSDKLDFIVQKATELGACEVVPVISKRCVSRPDSKSAAKKVQRCQKIAEEAAKQSGRGKIPTIGEFISFKEIFTRHDDDNGAFVGIIFYEGGGKRLGDIESLKNADSINIIIGSEGGFETEEVALAEKNGYITATLGKRILRAETAPICALSVLMNLTENE